MHSAKVAPVMIRRRRFRRFACTCLYRPGSVGKQLIREVFAQICLTECAARYTQVHIEPQRASLPIRLTHQRQPVCGSYSGCPLYAVTGLAICMSLRRWYRDIPRRIPLSIPLLATPVEDAV